jgi:hypothetical protein
VDAAVSERGRAWRCVPEPLSAWQQSLGWILAGVTLVETTLAAKILHLAHPIAVGVLMACSVPAIFPLRALLRAPRLRCADGRLELDAQWIGAAATELPTGAPLDRVDLSGVAVVDLDQRPDLRPADPILPARRATGPMPATRPDVVSGWRRLANGAPAHVWVVAGSPALYVPTTAGVAFLLALPKPDEVVAELRDRARRHSGAAVVGDSAA